MRANQSISFTKAALERLRCPGGRDRLYVYDARTPALAFCVTAAGKRSFYLYRRVQHRPQRFRLGGYPDLSVEQARRKAAATNGDIARGVNPQSIRRASRDEMTIGELFAAYLDVHAKVHKKTWLGDQQQYDRHLSKWKARTLTSVTRADVKAMHAKVGEGSGPYAANRLLALLSCLFNFAADHFDWPGANPARGVQRFRERKRERFMDRDELPRFLDALDADASDAFRDYVTVLLLTGARRGNVQSMAWADLNLERGTWLIPDTKSGDAQTVYLPPEVVELLRRRGCGLASPFVFPGTGASGHLVEPKKAWASLLKRAGVTKLRLHDLRRTFGSWQATTGASLPTIGKSLGHKNQSTTAIYARMNLDPVKESVNAAVGAMLASRNPPTSPATTAAGPAITKGESTNGQQAA